MKNEISIAINDIYKSYKTNEVLKGISFEVKRGSMLALLGPNGAGKTTTVRIMSTLLKPDKGSVIIEGHDAIKHPDRVRKVIGLTGQSAAIDELLSGRENLVMMGQLYRLTKSSARDRAQELLEDFDLLEAADRPSKTYSGGMRRRLDLAVSLIATPPVIFLDEPTTGLDPRSRIAMWDIIRTLMSKGTTILLTTQYLEEADQLADNVILIDGGTIIAEGTPQQLKRKIGNDLLILHFDGQQSLKKAHALLKKEVVTVDGAEKTLTLRIKDPSTDVLNVLNALTRDNIVHNGIDIHKPSLDDVFLTMTAKKQKENQ